MSVDFNPASGTAAAQSQATVLTLSKSLKLEQSTAAQLLQGLPGAGGGTSPPGPPVAGMGQQLDAFA
jgi:hypothetical protein